MEAEGSLLCSQDPETDPCLGQINPLEAPSHFFTIGFNIILKSEPGLSQCSLALKFFHLYPVCTSSLPHTCCMLRLSHYVKFGNVNSISVRNTELEVTHKGLSRSDSSYSAS